MDQYKRTPGNSPGNRIREELWDFTGTRHRVSPRKWAEYLVDQYVGIQKTTEVSRTLPNMDEAVRAAWEAVDKGDVISIMPGGPYQMYLFNKGG